MTSHEYTFNYDVHVFDTDCYGVVWHGAYAKWLEMGRVDLFKSLGLDMREASAQYDIIFPVAQQTVKFRASARFGDKLRLKTALRVHGPKLIFDTDVHDLDTDRHVLSAQTDVVMTNAEGKLYRRLPEFIQEKLGVKD